MPRQRHAALWPAQAVGVRRWRLAARRRGRTEVMPHALKPATTAPATAALPSEAAASARSPTCVAARVSRGAGGTRAAGSTHQRGAALCCSELRRLGRSCGGVESARALRRRRRAQHGVAAAEHRAREERSRAARCDGIEVGALRQRARSHALPPRALGRGSGLSGLSGHALGRRAWASAGPTSPRGRTDLASGTRGRPS